MPNRITTTLATTSILAFIATSAQWVAWNLSSLLLSQMSLEPETYHHPSPEEAETTSHSIRAELKNGKIQFAIAVEVPHGNHRGAVAGIKIHRRLEASITIAEQDDYIAAAGVCHSDIWLAVAVEIAHGNSSGKSSDRITFCGREIDSGNARGIFQQKKKVAIVTSSNLRLDRMVNLLINRIRLPVYLSLARQTKFLLLMVQLRAGESAGAGLSSRYKNFSAV